LTLREDTSVPFEEVAVNLVGPWSINIDGNMLDIQAFTIINIATTLSEVVRIEDKSAIILPFGQYCTETSPTAIQSVTKKYLMLMCQVRLLLDTRPCFSSKIELWLSPLMMNSFTP
jgi:hypothetical protein